MRIVSTQCKNQQNVIFEESSDSSVISSMVEGNIQMSWKTIQTGSISKDLMKLHSQNKYKGISSVDPQSKESGLFLNQQN